MQTVRTCDHAHHLLPLVVCVASVERKEVVRPFLAVSNQDVEKDGMLLALTKGITHHPQGFLD